MTNQEKVGRGHPPKDRQFGRGQKRAAGRPKGALGEKAIVQKIAGEVHKIQQNGETVEVTTLELLLLTMRNLAMKGDIKAAKWLTEYRERVLTSDATGGFLVVPEVMPIDKFFEQQAFLNRFRINPELNEPFGIMPASSEECEPGVSLASLDTTYTVGLAQHRAEPDRNTALVKEGEFESPETIAAIERNREDRERTVVIDR